ncbi:MAG: hypothetical protein WC156_10000 [Pedobacter sp.]
MEAHILGFPRIGSGRELKMALESYWRGSSTKEDLYVSSNALKERHWRFQRENGLSMVTVGDFSLYDQMLDTTCLLGMTPERFGVTEGEPDITTYFCMARGDAANNIPAMEMTKWFDTNYHYIVPEFTPKLTIKRSSNRLIEETWHALAHGFRPKFNSIAPWIAAMDADVISVEASRSKMKLLEAFRNFDYPNEIGPGIYDIHSPRVPEVEEMVALIRQALEVVPKERLWINPDCGLKTRQWPETIASLQNMVAAAHQTRLLLAAKAPKQTTVE